MITKPPSTQKSSRGQFEFKLKFESENRHLFNKLWTLNKEISQLTDYLIICGKWR